MRRVHLFLCIGGLAVIASYVLVVQAVHPSLEASAPRRTPADAGGDGDSSALTELVTPRFEATDGARKAVTPELVEQDPCSSIKAELEAERAARSLAEQEIAKLREKLATVTRELNALEFPESTPYGAFLASSEAEEMRKNIMSGSHLYEAILDDLRNDIQRCQTRIAKDPSLHNTHHLEVLSGRLQRFSENREAAVDYVFSSIKGWLDEFPVMLQLGEATWMADRLVLGREGDDELIRFLGPSRVVAAMSVDKLFEDLLWDEDYGPALQAALPPDKRAELAAKLHAHIEKSDDPEEIAWLLERFPSFFD